MASKDKKQVERRNDSVTSEMMHRFKTRPLIFIGTIFILVLVVVAFVFIPAMVPQGGGIDDFTFGYFNRIPIRMVSGNFFHQVQQSLTQQHQHLFGGGFDDLRLTHHIWRMSFEEAVIYTGIQDTMRRAGFVVPPNVVDREMARRFQLPDGRFDTARYRAMDSATRMNIWRETQEGIAIGRYLADIQNLRISSNAVSFIGSMASPRRSFSVAIFPLASYPDSEVISFAEQNQEPFRITHLSRVTVTSEWEAQQLLEMVRTGALPFEEVARNNSIDAFSEAGGDMGMRMVYELIPEIWDPADRESVINMASGELSEVVSVSMGWAGMGWAFFRAEEAIQPPDITDSLQLDRIRRHIMTTLRGRVEDWVITEAENFAAQVRERDFEEVAAEGNIMRRNFGPIPINFGDSTFFSMVSTAGVPEIQHAGRDQFFWRATFATPLLTPSNPVVLGDNVMIFFPLEETYADEFDIGPIEAYYAARVRDYIAMTYRRYFLENERLDDRFEQTFWRQWRPN